MLNVEKDVGWIQSKIKCPHFGKYTACLDDDLRVHLFSFNRIPRTHHLVALRDIPEIADVVKYRNDLSVNGYLRAVLGTSFLRVIPSSLLLMLNSFIWW